MMFATVHALLPSQKAGKLKFLAVTGPRRSPLAPDAPTFRERGFDFMDDIDGWYAVMGPARLPRDIRRQAQRRAPRDHVLRGRARAADEPGTGPAASTPEELAALIKADLRAGRRSWPKRKSARTDSDMRRVVTGHDAKGRAVVLMDGEAPHGFFLGRRAACS